MGSSDSWVCVFLPDPAESAPGKWCQHSAVWDLLIRISFKETEEMSQRIFFSLCSVHVCVCMCMCGGPRSTSGLLGCYFHLLLRHLKEPKWNSSQWWHRPTWSRLFLSKTSSQVTLDCVMLTIKTNHYSVVSLCCNYNKNADVDHQVSSSFKGQHINLLYQQCY